MLVVLPFVIAASFLGRIKGGNIIYRICCLWGDVWFPLIGIRHQNIHTTPLNPSVAQIFVANHVAYLDAALLVKTFRMPLRALGKAEIGKVPLFGYIYRKAIVTVDRSSAANRSRSVQVLKAVLRTGISVLVFPEGTFNETGKPLKDFYDGAFRIAIETGTPIRPVLMLDSWSRMPPGKWLSLNPGRSRAVFLEPVPVAGLTKEEVGKLKEQVYRMMEQGLLSYDAAWIKDKSGTLV
ncbi:1-acyl-sn-glycerol-3-phosphate acyltransferase [Cnuella takakiae]|nr:1-acyl-sn-glycerol-3-phosphate acyltransferase [Cnuella takakiae]